MKCPNCGNNAEEAAKFCVVCGTKLVADDGEQVETADPEVIIRPDQPVLPKVKQGMGFYKFVIYFQLFAVAALNVVNAIAAVMGSQYLLSGVSYQSIAYTYQPIMRYIDLFYGFLYLGLAVYSIYVRTKLVKFKKNAKWYYLSVFFFSILLALTYLGWFNLILGGYLYYQLNTLSLVASICWMGFFNFYFTSRENLFIN